MVGQKRFKRWTILFTLLSLVAWLVYLATRDSGATQCEAEQHTRTRQTRLREQALDTQYISMWFSNEVKNHFTLTNSICPPVRILVRTETENKLSRQQLKTEFDYFGAVVSLGNLRVREYDDDVTNGNNNAAVHYLTNVTKMISQLGHTFSMLSGVINDGAAMEHTVRWLGEQGVSLLSIANPQVSSLVELNQVQPLVQVLEAADMSWLGLNAKAHHIAVIEGKRVGFIALCAGHGQCTQSSTSPFAPLKYTPKAATSIVNTVREYGVDVIVVLLHWGRDSGVLPDETLLPPARKMAQLGVNLVVGYGPNVVLDHAYFGNTLIIFSMGNLLSFGDGTPYCWKKGANEWVFDDITEHCKSIHPSSRQSVFTRELSTRIYQIHLSKQQAPVAEYTTLSLVHNRDGVRVPSPSDDSQWTTVCGHSDNHCLSCTHL